MWAGMEYDGNVNIPMVQSEFKFGRFSPIHDLFLNVMTQVGQKVQSDHPLVEIQHFSIYVSS